MLIMALTFATVALTGLFILRNLRMVAGDMVETLRASIGGAIRGERGAKNAAIGLLAVMIFGLAFT